MRVPCLLLALLLSTPALAAEAGPAPEPDHPLHVEPEVDLPLIFAAALPTAIYATGLVEPAPAGYLSSRADVNPLDRAALDVYRPDVSTASDVAWIAMMALPMIDHAVESGVASRKRGLRFGRRFGSDLAVYAEAMAFNALITELIKITATRPRPLAYMDPADVADGSLRAELRDRQDAPDSAKSFLSGHSSASFTAAAVWSMLWTLKQPDRPGALVAMWVGSFAGASAIATMRVVAGKHHPTDVLAGAALGTAVGILTPLAHRGKRPAPVVVVPMLGGDIKGAMVVGRLP
jgi:membrane-associated phospholipid phosphatase